MWQFPLGRIFGVPVRAHFSWVLLIVLAVSMLQPWFAELRGANGLPPALLATLLLLVGVIAHELGHALVALRYGRRVKAITLYLTGGVTELDDDPHSPGEELAIALAGPAVSLVLALVATTLALLVSPAMAPFWWLQAGANALLVLFNLLPWPPLDGGRALRAVFWFLHDDIVSGTHVTMRIGRLLGQLLILCGVFIAITADPASGVITALLGWGATRAVAVHYFQTALHHTLRRLIVRELMIPAAQTVSPHLTLDAFAGQYLMGRNEQVFPVVHAERMLGLITAKNLRAFAIPVWRETMVGEAMIPLSDLPAIGPDDRANAAYEALMRRQIDQLPVIDHGQLLGMIRYRDMMSAVSQALQKGSKP